MLLFKLSFLIKTRKKEEKLSPKKKKGRKDPQKNKLPRPTDLSEAYDRIFGEIKKNHERASNKPEK